MVAVTPVVLPMSAQMHMLLGPEDKTVIQQQVLTAADQPEVYLPLLEGKRVALLSNHTSFLTSPHLYRKHLDNYLLDNKINVTSILTPEHGYMGTASAGEKVESGVDLRKMIPIVSLYDGKGGEGLKKAVAEADVVVCDLQDVGVRFYTYHITMIKAMEEAARQGKEFIVMDRPNPLGMIVDGPILDMTLASGVGRLPIPVIHGMTMGELAQMAVGEHWLKTDKELQLTVIPCKEYTHSYRYVLHTRPSPNLKHMQAVYLYPSLCPFEGTVMSVGRGTDTPFCIYGHPKMEDYDYTFTPRDRSGARKPPFQNQLCHGYSLMDEPVDSIIARGFDLSYVIDAYNDKGMKLVPKFFTPFFDKLTGNRDIRKMIEAGMNADEISATWQEEVERFKEQRKPYLLYPL